MNHWVTLATIHCHVRARASTSTWGFHRYRSIELFLKWKTKPRASNQFNKIIDRRNLPQTYRFTLVIIDVGLVWFGLALSGERNSCSDCSSAEKNWNGTTQLKSRWRRIQEKTRSRLIIMKEYISCTQTHKLYNLYCAGRNFTDGKQTDWSHGIGALIRYTIARQMSNGLHRWIILSHLDTHILIVRAIGQAQAMCLCICVIRELLETKRRRKNNRN